MDYRTILVELTTERAVATNVPVALGLADRFNATCVGLHVMPEPDPAYAHPTAAPLAARDRVKAAFQSMAGGDARIEWIEAEGDPGQLLLEWALTADLAVVAQRGPGGQYDPDIADRLIQSSGVPTLMLPWRATTAAGGGTVLVGWSGSSEATRAVREALPFLVRAERVVVCAIGDVAIRSLDAAAGMLRRHCVRANPEAMDGSDAAAGEILVRAALACGADLMVTGSYGHSRRRELLFGGVTRFMLHSAPLPVLFGS